MDTIKMQRLTFLRSWIDYADSAYYRPGFKPIATDADYDLNKAELRALAPDDQRLTRVGVPYSADELRTKKTHRMPMGSLDNTDNGILGLDDWYTKTAAKLANLEPELLLTHKMDGVSIGMNYDNGILVSVISRGDGNVGEDITTNAVHFRGVPTVLNLPITCSVRGEAMLHKADFTAITAGRSADDKTNPRNICNGIVGRSDGENADLVTVYAFNIEGDNIDLVTAGERLALLDELGFNPVTSTHCHSVQRVTAVYEEMLAARQDLPYEIDGLVIELYTVADQKKFITKDPKSKLRPKYARAIKFPMYFATTKVTGVLVTVGHTASIIPTAQLEPVWVGGEHQGVTVQNALLTNYDEVKRLDVAVGDTVEVALAGDIIPKIIRVLERPADRKPIKEPVHCPSCGDSTTRVNRGKVGANLYCSNEDCSGVMVGKIHHWIGNSKKGVGILDIGDAMEAALYEQELVSDPSDLYKLTPEMIENVLLNGKTRIGRSRAEKVVANIQAKKHIPLNIFLGSLGMDLLGRRRALLLAEAAEGELDTLDDWLDDEKLSTIQVAGLGDETRTAIRNGISRCKPLISRLLANGVVATPLHTVVHDPAAEAELTEVIAAEMASNPFLGRNFVFTGTREGTVEVAARGGNIQDGVRKGTHYLVQKDSASTSNKTKKAAEVGATVISVDLLKQVFAGTAELP